MFFGNAEAAAERLHFLLLNRAATVVSQQMPEDDLVEIDFDVAAVGLVEADRGTGAVDQLSDVAGRGGAGGGQSIEADVQNRALRERAPVLVGELEFFALARSGGEV